MKLLLFFSAIFSALTGVVTGSRAAGVPAEQVSWAASSAIVRVAAVVAKQAAPVQTPDRIAAQLIGRPLVRFAVAAIPPFMGRRRE